MENNDRCSEPSSSLDKENNSKDKSDNSKKYKFYRKPSIKKKGPEVKQTRTSLKRMLQANPLMKYEMEGIPLPNAGIIVQRQNSQTNFKSTLKNHMQVDSDAKKPKDNSFLKPCGIIKLAGNEPNPHARPMSLNSERLSGIDFNNTNKILSSTVLETVNKNETKSVIESRVENATTKAGAKQSMSKISKDSSNFKQKVMYDHGVKRSKSVTEKGRKSLRRSFSAQHFDCRKGISDSEVNESQRKVQPTQSLENISVVDQAFQRHEILPIAEVSQEVNLVFKTPSAYERRSVCRFTPRSTNISRRSIYQPSNALPTLEDLQKRLNDWLVKRGKSISLFSHLKLFQSPAAVEENKENIEVGVALDNGSYEDLRIPQTKDESENVRLDELERENLEVVAKAALVDLNQLIRDGYPVIQCEGWLEVIKTKYKKLQEEPEYWECRAAIEQSRGNLTNAVECYRTAIVQGAEVQEVDKSLDILLQKFSLLNINTENMEDVKASRERVRIVQDARNVFKSSIIKFAVQEKKLKKSGIEKQLVATPVRRSTRLSRSAYTSTPGVKICSSLRELEGPERENLDFRKNNAFV